MLYMMLLMSSIQHNDVWSCNAFSIHSMMTTRSTTTSAIMNSPQSSTLLNVLPSSFSSTLISDISSTIPTTTSDTAALSSSTNIIIFIIGLIPFLWATYEFWSRIAVGASFGTGKDSIQIKPSSSSPLTTIGKDNDMMKSRGRRVLGDDALYVAYLLFVIAIGSVGIAIYSVLSSAPPPPSSLL